MANKNYIVYGENGEELKTRKTLAAAKKLADAENGFVLMDGECMYRATEEPAAEVEIEEQVVVEEQTETRTVEKQHFKILSLMNLRSKPAMNAPIIGQVKAGTVVIAQSIDNDWLNTAGGYILYGNGKYAAPVC